MANGYALKVTGLDELIKKFGRIPENLTTEMDAVLAQGASDFVNGAVNDAPVDRSELRQEITFEKLGLMNYTVVSAAPYSPYIEWGTRSRRQIPSDLTAYAANFQGRREGGGDYYDFLNNILDWVKRKGIASRFSVKTRKALKHTKSDDERLIETAQAIANSIIRHGINPHPFFFQQRAPVTAAIEQRLSPAIKKALAR